MTRNERMNMLKQTLLVLGVLSVAGTAVAGDITNPFYLASKGQFGSVTSATLKRVKEKSVVRREKSDQKILQEELRYGLTDSLALLASVGNTWDRWENSWSGDSVVFKDKKNANWAASIGMGWNIFSGPVRWQVSAQYGQDRLKNFSGEYKYVKAETKLGYQFKRAVPYVTGGVEIPLFQKSGIKGYAGDKFIYNTKAGVYQGKCEVWALDTGVRLTYDENRESRVVTAEAEASYYITPEATIGIYGTYALVGKAKFDTDIYDKSAGVRLRLFF